MAMEVKIDDDVIERYQNLRWNQGCRYLLMKLSNNHQEVKLEKFADRETNYKDFLSDIRMAASVASCRFAIFDDEYPDEHGAAVDHIVLFTYLPDAAAEEQKKLYTAVGELLKTQLVGIVSYILARKISDLDMNCVEQLRKHSTSKH